MSLLQLRECGWPYGRRTGVSNRSRLANTASAHLRNCTPRDTPESLPNRWHPAALYRTIDSYRPVAVTRVRARVRMGDDDTAAPTRGMLH
ncbi:hypothetical protein GCM10010452_35130 [Crossiella cryophila]